MSPPFVNSPRLRIGGMAFGNGVLMRGPNYWAWARDDGTVLEAPVHTWTESHRWLRFPLVRSAVLLGEMFALMFRLHRLNGRRRALRLLGFLLLAAAVNVSLGTFLPLVIPSLFAAEILLLILGFSVMLAAMRLGLGSTVWRFHGAEHKAVNAYEHGEDMSDVGSVMKYSRVHDRCGTNLVAVCLLLLLLGYLPLAAPVMAGIIGTLYGVAVLLISVEVFRLLVRRPRSGISRTLLAGGKALQRCVTTKEPTADQLELACVALIRVLDLENGRRVPGA